MRRLTSYFVTSFLVAGAAAAGADTPKQTIKTPAQLTVTSTAIRPDGTIAQEFTCDGAGVTPAISWTTPPAETKSLAVVVEDPDAPGKTFTHWIVTGIPATVSSLTGTSLPEHAVAGTSDKGTEGWVGPCPPSGRHRYMFHVFALDVDLSKKLDRKELTSAMAGHVLAAGVASGTYMKQAKK